MGAAHYQHTADAINAGKHVFTEWPLGRILAEAQEMADLARAKNVRHVVGLQARLNPAVMHMTALVEEGYVGEVVGPFSHVASVVSTQAKQWLETDTQKRVDVTGPDNVLVSGRLANSADTVRASSDQGRELTVPVA